MNFWIINQKQTKPVYKINSNFFSVKIETKKDKLPVQSKDGFVIFDINKAKFQSYGKINTVSEASLIPHKDTKSGEKPKKSYTITGEISNKLTKINSINDLSYSLLRVTSHTKPQNHFKHQITTVAEDDYKTIVNGLIYIARTAFGKIVNALPLLYKLEFYQLAVQKFKTDKLNKVEYVKLLEFLQEYLEERILEKGRLIVETDDLIKNNLSDILPHNKIGFYEQGKENKITHDSLHKQANIFRKLFDIDANNKIINKIKKSIKENEEIENRFNKLFKRKSLPLYI